jgi:CheY-specific phosphatase CheX
MCCVRGGEIMSDELPIDEVRFVMQSVVERTRAYLEGEYGIGITEVDSCEDGPDCLMLFDMTAIVGMGGRINLLVAFSFQDRLISELYARMTEGFDVPPEEADTYREAAAGEVANTILGNCTIDLQDLDRGGISMTPPVVLSQVKTIRRMKGSMFYRNNIKTVAGGVAICLVGPKGSLLSGLEYAK